MRTRHGVLRARRVVLATNAFPSLVRRLAVQATRWSLARADRHSGRRNLWLRALDAAGLGFDS